MQWSRLEWLYCFLCAGAAAWQERLGRRHAGNQRRVAESQTVANLRQSRAFAMAGERRPPRLVAAACCRRRHSCRGRRNWHRCRLHRPRSLPSRALAAMAEPTLNAATAAAHPSATAACCLRCRHRPVRISDLPLAATQGPRWALFTSRHRVCSDNQSVLRHASHCPPRHGGPCDGP